MAQTARHARVPPHGSVRQRQPFDGEGLRLSVRTAGTAARHGTPAFLVHRRRCGDGRNADVLLRERAAAVVHHALPCAGRRNTAQPESRQMVLRFLQGLRTEPLRTRIPTRFLCRQAIRRIHRSEHHALHLRLPDTHLHHAARAEQILRHLHAAALPGDLFLPQRTVGLAARHGQQSARGIAAGENLHHLLPSPLRQRLHAARPERGLRPGIAVRGNRPALRTGTHRMLHGAGQHASRLPQRHRSMDGIPAEHRMGTESRFASLRHAVRGRPLPTGGFVRRRRPLSGTDR